MPAVHPFGYAMNATRGTYLATRLTPANTHWTRLRGLMGKESTEFGAGSALWIVPCHGVHTIGMRIPIDVLYLDKESVVVHVQENLKPWRFAPVLRKAVSVLELPVGTIAASGTTAGDNIEVVLNKAADARV